MGTHTKAWAGISILIFDETPSVPMKIEQAISENAPALEVKLDSFENYSDALDFCKTSKQVGLLIIGENTGSKKLGDVFRELSKPYLSRGLPAFGTVFYNQTKSITGLNEFARTNEIIEYTSLESLTDPILCSNTLTSLWHAYTHTFEEYLIPQQLKDTFYSLSEPEFGKEKAIILERIITLLSSNLNLSWVDATAAKWAPIIYSLQKSHPSALTPHAGLMALSDVESFKDARSIDTGLLAKSSTSLWCKVAAIAEKIALNPDSTSVTQFLDEMTLDIRPSSPALLRHLQKHKQKIVEISQQMQLSELVSRKVA